MVVKKKVGRPSDYLPEVGDDICSLLATGESLNKICQLEHMPGRTTVYRWIREHDEFRNNYARATEDRADSIFEEMLDIADSAEEETASIAKARLQIDARKWILGKMNPKKYSDKQTVEMTGANGGPIDMSLKVVFEDDGETSTK